MKTVTVQDQPLTVNSGQVQLTAAQALTRKHAIKPVEVDDTGAGLYAVVSPLQFKKGEKFGFDGDMGKTGVLRDLAAEQAAATDAALAELLAKLKPETAAAVRAELAAPAKPSKSAKK